MDTQEVLAIVGVTPAVITVYSLVYDLTDESLDPHAPQTGLMHVQAQMSAPHR